MNITQWKIPLVNPLEPKFDAPTMASLDSFLTSLLPPVHLCTALIFPTSTHCAPKKNFSSFLYLFLNLSFSLIVEPEILDAGAWALSDDWSIAGSIDAEFLYRSPAQRTVGCADYLPKVNSRQANDTGYGHDTSIFITSHLPGSLC